MTGIVSHPYRGSEDLPALIEFASRLTAARFPGLTRWNPGDIAWQLGMFPDSFAFETFVRLWEADGRVVALAIFEPPVNFEYDVDPAFEHDALAPEILSWVKERRATIRGAEGEIPNAYAML